ncbi:NOL1/NOP2/sun family-domain-containing protein [Podospora didyma]|uniref:Nucleolar protein 2 n=1 Tax=Podospora didyma TaxID=330526 RepID=A0AAE0P4T9_9PEZI|nr:NOL1/NOP2/sun family-domain-containing protein [Podospora didyma]
MGVGRRMQKQGAPEPLSEEHYASLKRKKGIAADAFLPEAPNKKPRIRPKKPLKGAKGQEKPNAKGAAPKPAAKAAKPKKAPAIGSDDDEFGASDLDDVDPMDGVTLGDDFLDSGDDDDSVYDSDQDRPKGSKESKKEAFVFSDDEDDNEDREEKLTAANIEGLSQKLDKKLAEEAAENEAELREAALQTNIAGDTPNILGDDDDDDELAAKKTLLAPDLQMLRTRITETIRVLEDFSNLAEEGQSRVEYTNQLLKDFCAYYGYNEFLAEKLINLFPAREAFAFFEANESPRPVVIRTNTLRTHRRDLAQALINRGVTLEPVGKWSKVGLQVFDTNVPLGATPEYLAGHYILQAASSFLPVMALCPQENERVLDMAAAPGGKTSHMAALMKNTGCIFANDPSKKRAKGLIGNIHRLGARNVIVCNYDAREFPRVMGGFDRVLLDAPCSGTGVIAKDPTVKTNRDEKDFQVLPHTQKQLLLAAIDSVNHASKTGGYLVYSTCSVAVEENEQVVAYALSRRPNVKLVETGLPFGKEGFTSFMGKDFPQSMKMTRRFYPHLYNVDGFFVAKFQKIGPTPANAVMATKDKNNQAKPRSVIEVENEAADKTPIKEDGEEEGEFEAFAEEEDQEYILRAKRNAMRRRGLDPRALKKPPTERKPRDAEMSDAVSDAVSDAETPEKGKKATPAKEAKDVQMPDAGTPEKGKKSKKAKASKPVADESKDVEMSDAGAPKKGKGKAEKADKKIVDKKVDEAKEVKTSGPKVPNKGWSKEGKNRKKNKDKDVEMS